MISLELFRTMSRYNRWMNANLYRVCETIPDAVRKEDRGAFFRSMHGTLNHLLLADRLWMGRFTGQLFAVQALNQELYADFETLRLERERTDAEIEAWVAGLTEEEIAASLTFTSVSTGAEYTNPMWKVLTHMFNHQTHHRGQLTTLMNQLGYDSGVTDLLLLPASL